MFISSNDDDLFDARIILNYFFKRPYGYTNPEPALLKELPLKDQIIVLDILCNYYDKDFLYNFKIYEKLAVALTKQGNYKLAKLIVAGGVEINRLKKSSAENILASIENLNNRILVNSETIYNPTYEEAINNLKYHLSEKAMETYKFAGLDVLITVFSSILIDYCILKMKKNDS